MINNNIYPVFINNKNEYLFINIVLFDSCDEFNNMIFISDVILNKIFNKSTYKIYQYDYKEIINFLKETNDEIKNIVYINEIQCYRLSKLNNIYE